MNLQTKATSVEEYPDPVIEKERLHVATQLLKNAVQNINNEAPKPKELRVYQRRPKTPEANNSILNPPIIHQDRDSKIQTMIQWSHKLYINIPLGYLLESLYKGTLTNNRIEESTLLASHEDEDLKIPMHIFSKIICKTIVDGGSNVNVIPASTWEQLGKPQINPAYYSIKLANQSKI